MTAERTDQAARRKMKPADAACLAAVDLARDAAVAEFGADVVGDAEGHEVDDDRVVTHYFASRLPGYMGWHWAVTVARASRAKQVTVDEAVLLPGRGALLPPAWVPWSERLRPGDLGPGDLLPTAPDDPRLVPGYTGTDVEPGDRNDPADLHELSWELGLDRVRVLSAEGVDEAADRWINGDQGPLSPLAMSAPAHCDSCGFYVRVAGLLGQVFGVCTNEYSPSDGRVVSYDHGCGAHSEGVTSAVGLPRPAPVADSLGYDDLGHS
ncbi:MAG: DUF3027 domain-containing protein [Candidatus Nanopelagicales bacterium]